MQSRSGTQEETFIVEGAKLIKRELIVEVPKYITSEQIKYITKEQEQIKYNTLERDTIRYNLEERRTIKYVPQEETTTKFIPKEVECEKPIVKIKTVSIVDYKDVDAIRSLIEEIPKLKEEMVQLKQTLDNLKDYKLVEEIIRVPKNEYVPTPVERIVWKDINRERCKECGKEIR